MTCAADPDWTGFVAHVRDVTADPVEVLILAEDRRTSVCRLVLR